MGCTPSMTLTAPSAVCVSDWRGADMQRKGEGGREGASGAHIHCREKGEGREACRGTVAQQNKDEYRQAQASDTQHTHTHTHKISTDNDESQTERHTTGINTTSHTTHTHRHNSPKQHPRDPPGPRSRRC